MQVSRIFGLNELERRSIAERSTQQISLKGILLRSRSSKCCKNALLSVETSLDTSVFDDSFQSWDSWKMGPKSSSSMTVFTNELISCKLALEMPCHKGWRNSKLSRFLSGSSKCTFWNVNLNRSRFWVHTDDSRKYSCIKFSRSKNVFIS
ncbi:hypothetical protein OGAPHI_004053 [Ogataea philodendri]|uniref:Uncharacterized protein n=1 Tax=Ogataea philodendri TaxID=1378263 RepID=A0A9P8P604_9ASCO|nr:uncharacterized protein OGAPHI_004053 [Ogataea philodendri]KAH3665865.1 hypothetical protein OGAPHI_004053 [Ogataea philodendri]